MSVPAYVTLTGHQTTVIVVTFSVASGAAAGTIINGTMYPFGANQPGVSAVTVPSTEVWSIVNMYTLSTYTPDAQVLLYVNGYQQDIMPTLNSIYINNYNQWKLKEAFKLPPTATWNINIVLLGTSSSAQTYYLYLSVVRAPYIPTRR